MGEAETSKSLKTFRRKMANPVYWRKANRVFTQYTRADVASVESAIRLIDDLSCKLNVDLSPADKRNAAQWLVKQGMDPQSRRDRLGLWRKVK